MKTRSEILLENLSENSKRILGYILSLSYSQGFYGRLLRDLLENPEAAEDYLAQFHGCTTCLDFVLAIEC